NTIRMPFSGELVDTGGGMPSGIDPGLNPDLVGLNGLEILDAIVDYADVIGLNIILDYHRGPVGGGPNENGLWFGEGRTEADVIAEWETMATRYADKPAVIGADLINEPFMATWGDGSATDWAAAAERIGGAVQAIAPHWLILVEGVSTYDGDPYWWGGNLQGVADRPVVLPVPGKLVYSPHDYPASVHPQEWFFDGTSLTDKFRQNWGYIAEEGIAPVLVGEWGSRLETAEDLRWGEALARYMNDVGVSWLWWSLNPNSGDTGGVFADDWTTVRAPVMGLLDPYLAPTRPDISFTDTSSVDTLATFDVSLAEPAAEDVTLKYATTDGTAKAGADYKATAGTLTIPAGAMSATVTVPILPDMTPEGDEFFYLVLGQGGAMRASSTALIADTDDAGDGGGARRTAPSPAVLPFVDVASTVVSEGAGAARFRIILSEPTDRDVTIDYATHARTASGADFEEARGTVVIPAGAPDVILEVSVGDDDLPEPAERFTLELTSANGAEIRSAEAMALIPAEPAAAAEVAVTRSATADTQATIDLILENDWGSGALFNVVIKNESDRPISRWELSLDLPFDLAELWSAVLVDDTGARVTVQNAQWNGEIAPGESVDFGFIADMGEIELGRLLNGADIELAVQ
ncbi:MAG: cellulase family glycosylhydrolase, partial [Pseudomonadota bacterium]